MKLHALTYQTLAEKIGVSRQMVSYIVRGLRTSPKVRQNMAQTFGFENWATPDPQPSSREEAMISSWKLLNLAPELFFALLPGGFFLIGVSVVVFIVLLIGRRRMEREADRVSKGMIRVLKERIAFRERENKQKDRVNESLKMRLKSIEELLRRDK